MGFTFPALVLFLALVYTAWRALPTPPVSPTSTSPNPKRGAVYSSAGPVLASRIENLSLDGLTIIPTTRLPRLKARLALPFTQYTLILSLDLSTSETVLRRLRVGSAKVRGRDVIRERVTVEAEGVEVEMEASAGVKVEAVIEKREVEGGATRKVWGWRTVSNGRVELALSGAELTAVAQLVGGPSPATPAGDESGETALSPRLAFLSSSLSPGNISLLSLSPSFAPNFPLWLANPIFSTLIPAVRNTPPSRILTSNLVSFLLREVLESHVTDELLADLGRFLAAHVDSEVYGSITDEERETVLSDFFAAPPPPTTNIAVPPSLGFSTVLHGPTVLTHFPLPVPPSSALPIFASTSGGGLRSKILSSPILNQVTTGPPAVELGLSEFEKIAFKAARVELAPPVQGTPERELILAVTALDAVLSTTFSISSTLRTAPSLLLGGNKNLLTPGSATTHVSTSPLTPLRIRLPLAFLTVAPPSSSSSAESHDDADAGGWRIQVLGRTKGSFLEGVASVKEGGVRIEGEFQKITPRVKIESKILGRVGERVVNAVLEAVEAIITPLTAPLASFFLADLARLRLQEALDDVCGRVRDEGGVEWTLPKAPPVVQLVGGDEEKKTS